MDQIIRQFAQKTPVHLLEKHRLSMRKIMHIASQPVQSVRNVFGQFGHRSEQGLSSTEEFIMADSTVEGASLARLFSPDEKTSSEVEYDFMISLIDWHWEEALAYVNNRVFVHILLHSEVSKQVGSFCGVDAVQKLFCHKEDGVYLSSQLLQIWFKELLAQQPDAFNAVGGRPWIAYKRCDSGNAAISVEVDTAVDDEYVAEESPSCDDETATSATGFASRQVQISRPTSANEKFNQIIKEIIPCCEEFEIRIAEMFTRLERV